MPAALFMEPSLDKAIETLPGDTADKLRFELIRVQIEGLKLAQETMRANFDKKIEDHEKRIRAGEEVNIKFNFLLYLTMGGGLVSLINLALLVFALLKAVKP